MRKYDFKQANWCTQAKQDYRQICVIDRYRAYFDRINIPDDLYYWSICGMSMLSEEDRWRSEVGQLIKNGLIKERQFVGVDRDKDIIEANRKKWPQSTWSDGEFSEILHRNLHMTPAIIHADTTMLTINAPIVVSDIIYAVEFVKNPVMVVINSVAKRWRDKDYPDYKTFIDQIDEYPFSDKWERDINIYNSVGGEKHATSEMATNILFYRGIE